MAVSKKQSLTPTEIIDWLNDEGVLELDWDFPEDGDLAEAGLDPVTTALLVTAVEDRFGFELEPKDLTKSHLATPTTLCALINSRVE